MKPWKLSIGTACVIGKKKMKADVLPTTAYIMLGEKCKNNCQFCAQSQDSEARTDLLSRVTWPAIPKGEATLGIGDSYRNGTIKRACLQVVQRDDSWETTINALELLHTSSEIPICVSSHLGTVDQAKELITRGAQRVCIALDAATPEVYKTVKRGQWASKWSLLVECAQALPGLITTHIIVGLGESEQEMVGRMATCIDQGITIGLFAFTPVRGTAWANHLPPTISHYRRIQIAHHLLKKGYQQSIIDFHNGNVARFNVPEEKLIRLLADGQAFETSGCEACNRPYYNERPGGLMYNYPRHLTTVEVAKAIQECEIVKGVYDELANY